MAQDIQIEIIGSRASTIPDPVPILSVLGSWSMILGTMEGQVEPEAGQFELSTEASKAPRPIIDYQSTIFFGGYL